MPDPAPPPTPPSGAHHHNNLYGRQDEVAKSRENSRQLRALMRELNRMVDEINEKLELLDGNDTNEEPPQNGTPGPRFPPRSRPRP